MRKGNDENLGRRSFSGKKPGKPSRPTRKTVKKSGGSKRPSSSSSSRRPSSTGSRRPASSSRRPASSSRRSKPRVRPAARAVSRQNKNARRPMPKPVGRRRVAIRRAGATAAGTAVAARAASRLTEENRADAERIEAEFESLEKQAQLSSVYDDIGNFDAKLVDYPLQLDALRDRGYVHSGQIEDQIEALDDKWDEIRPRVEKALAEQIERLESEIDETERKVDNMKNAASVRTAETAVNRLSTQVNGAERAVSNLYDGLETELNQIGYRLNRISGMVKLFEESPEIILLEAEGPLLAVEAEWEQDGDEGPDGYLFLTDQRLLFEQREEVVTKRTFGIFKSESEHIQKLLVEVQTSEIQELEHKEEGGFLGMGKDDIIEFVFTDSAPLTRARFHLDGQDSSMWAEMIKRVQTGDINDDRAEEYLDEVEEAEEIAASFPTQCSTCFAAIEPPARGATSVTCEFCGSVITPQTS